MNLILYLSNVHSTKLPQRQKDLSGQNNRTSFLMNHDRKVYFLYFHIPVLFDLYIIKYIIGVALANVASPYIRGLTMLFHQRLVY